MIAVDSGTDGTTAARLCQPFTAGPFEGDTAKGENCFGALAAAVTRTWRRDEVRHCAESFRPG